MLLAANFFDFLVGASATVGLAASYSVVGEARPGQSISPALLPPQPPIQQTYSASCRDTPEGHGPATATLYFSEADVAASLNGARSTSESPSHASPSLAIPSAKDSYQWSKHVSEMRGAPARRVLPSMFGHPQSPANERGSTVEFNNDKRLRPSRWAGFLRKRSGTWFKADGTESGVG